MSDSKQSDPLTEKDRRNREERLAGVKRWAEYVRDQPPEVWGPQQNAIIDSQLESARAVDVSAAQRRRIRKFGELAAEGANDDGDFDSDAD